MLVFTVKTLEKNFEAARQHWRDVRKDVVRGGVFVSRQFKERNRCVMSSSDSL